ncbi:hypothetical protein MMC30_003796 [Trapelia coarctata]|nr:hypothetical protein [Trapelia coarctata]
MAADSREPPPQPTPASSSQPPPPPSDPNEPSYDGKIYETFLPPTFPPPTKLSTYPSQPTRPSRAPENANALPGGSTNTAGGRIKEASLLDGLKSIKAQDFRELHQKPCVRDALLVGIGSGFLLGGGRMVFGASAWHSMSLAIGSFCVSSAGTYEFCQRRRALERQGMQRAAEIIDRKKIEKEREKERMRAERRRKREEEELAREREDQEKRRGRGWRFWGG